MNKLLISALVALSAGSAVMAQEVDNRPASQKAQDVYVEPTLRVKSTTTTTVIDPVTSEQKVIGVKEQTKVYDHGGQVIKSDEIAQGVAAPAVVAPQSETPVATPPQATAPQVPETPQAPAVQPKQVLKKEITDMSRPKQ